MKISKFFLPLLIFSLLIWGCQSNNSKNDENTSVENSEDNTLSNLENTNESADRTGEIMDVESLKSALPESLMGMHRTSHTGQQASLGSMNISTANAEYREDDKIINVTITDPGNLGGGISALAGWANIDVNSETEDGFERTKKINGNKVYERYSKSANNSEIAMIYDKRFIIAVNGQNVSIDDLEDAIKKIKIKN